MKRSRPEQAAPPMRLSADEFRQIAVLLHSWTGMIFRDNKHYYIERRVAERIHRTGMPNVGAYLALLPLSLSERQELINACTVNETYFYREDYQLSALSNHLLGELIKHRRPGDLIRLWSLPCSTGEEAYSIAIWLLENWPLVQERTPPICAPTRRTSPLAEKPRSQSMSPSTVSLSALRASPAGLENWPPVQLRSPPM